MKSKTSPRRCCKCRRPIEPDPRVGARQVTCGDEACQRERHADRCRAWRAANADVARSHYEDVVLPFRRRHPEYQRRWRLSRRLREIREKSGAVGGVLLTSLRALLSRAEALSKSSPRDAQSGVLKGELLDKAVAVLGAAIAALEQLEASVAQLRSMGL